MKRIAFVVALTAALAGSALAPLYAAFETFYENRKLGRGGEPHVET